MERNIDIEIWQKLKAGKASAFSYIFDTYFDQLVDYGCRFTKDRQLVKDAIQDLFLELTRKGNQLSDVDNIIAYLLKATRRRIVRLMNQNNRIENTEELEVFDLEYDTLQESEVWEKKLNLIAQALNQLPPRQKEVIYLKFYKGVSNSEASEIMNISYQSVGNLIQKALNKLKESLDEPMQAILFFFQNRLKHT
ncbi:sigma-70 family RNA polymerase sigma factor [Prolixibacteraceae bacterium JC049]|nr:sigma-70 family RNA polymerase sigma factor [Prolixibacteraceae bacterium JC049]